MSRSPPREDRQRKRRDPEAQVNGPGTAQPPGDQREAAGEAREEKTAGEGSGAKNLPVHGIIGESEGIRRVLEAILKVARLLISVLILGESGTGKELIARFLHAVGRGPGKPFVAINCAALPAALLESELFGHKKGAFTGADEDRPGLMEEAEGGTLFLDEIGELPLILQSKLLRAIEYGEIRRVGENKTRKVHVRVVSATSCDLAAMVAAKTFRRDLYARLSGYTIEVPPLRERGRDVVLIARHHLAGKTVKGKPAFLSRGAEQYLLRCQWKTSNVRELIQLLDRVVVDARSAHISARDIHDAGQAGTMPELLEEVVLGGEKGVLALIAKRGPMTNAGICSALRMSKTTAQRHLGELRRQKRIEVQGSGRSTCYALAAPAPRKVPEGLALGDREGRALELLINQGGMTRLQVQHALDLTERTALRTLDALVDLGLVTKAGQGRGVEYRAIDTGAAAPDDAGDRASAGGP